MRQRSKWGQEQNSKIAGLTTYHYDEAGRLLDERVSRLLEAPPATKPDGAKPRGASIVPRPTLDYHIARTYDDQGRLTVSVAKLSPYSGAVLIG